MKEEIARASRAHSVAMATVEASLKAERSRCQDIRVRLERQTREHQVALTNAEERLLHNQQELDKVRPGWDGIPKIRLLTTNGRSLLQMQRCLFLPVPTYRRGCLSLFHVGAFTTVNA